MLRSSASLLALCAAAFAMPALAADYWSSDEMPADNGLRTSFATQPSEWTGLGNQDDPLHFEFGARYWYSMGNATWSDSSGDFGTSDTSHTIEGHLRIEDHSSNVFASALAGYSARIDGSYGDPYDSGTINAGRIGYVGADIGWNPIGANGSGVGPLVGYMYWNNSPETTRSSFTTATKAEDIGWDTATGQTFVPMDSKSDNVDIHMLRLGVQGKGDFGMFDVTGSLAAVPYANVHAVLGNSQSGTLYDHSVYIPGNIHSVKASETLLDGWGYGAMADVMLRAHPTENWTFGVGGRVWYLQGTADATFDQATIGNPIDADGDGVYETGPSFGKQRYITLANPFSVLRYGLLAELTYKF